MYNTQPRDIRVPDTRPFVGSPHSLATPRSTADGPNPGAGTMGAHFSVEPGTRGETMWCQPAFVVSPAPLVSRGVPDRPKGVIDDTPEYHTPTFFPVGNRAASTLHGDAWDQRKRFLVVPPDRFNPIANAKGGNRRGAHDVRNIWRYAAGTVLGTKGRTPPIPVGS